MGATFVTIGARLRARLRAEDGVSLPELLAVLTILLVVLTPLVGSFASALRSETEQSQREAAYSAARLALQRMRTDVHCASGVTGVEPNVFGGFTLTLTEAAENNPGWCAAVIPAGSGANGVQWCTIPHAGSTTRFSLYRYLGRRGDNCEARAGSTFQIDYVAPPAGGWPTNASVDPVPAAWNGNLWPTAAACETGRLPTLALELNTSVDPEAASYRHYQLRDALALRNAVRC